MASVAVVAVCVIAGSLAMVLTHQSGSDTNPHKDPNWKLVEQTVHDNELALYPACSWSNSTLPSFIVPRNYEVELQANLDTPEKLIFGHIIVTADILEDTPCVVFNADEQAHWQIHQHTNEYLPSGEFVIPGVGEWVTSDKDDVQLIAEAGIKRARYNALLPRLARLHFRFKYNLADGQRGTRIQTWPGRNDSAPREVVTFVPPHIRQALPVFDDASFQATWNITIIAPDTTTAIFVTDCVESNRHVQHLPLHLQPWTLGIPDNYTAHHFKPTERLAPADVTFTLQYSQQAQ